MEPEFDIMNFDLGDLGELEFTQQNPDDLMFRVAEELRAAENVNEVEDIVDKLIGEQEKTSEPNVTEEHAEKTSEPQEADRQFREYIQSMRNKATQQKTEQVRRKFESYLAQSHGEKRPMQDIPPETLNMYMGTYFLTMKKSDGTNYEPDSLTAVHRALERHLRDVGYSENILTSDKFHTSRGVLAGKRKELKGQGKGNRPNRATALSEEDIESLWEQQILGSTSADKLQKTLYFFLCSGFGLRGCHEARQLKFGDIELVTDRIDGKEVQYLEFTERYSKTRQGVEGGDCRPFKPKIFAIGGQRCPVAFYQKFVSMRPESMLLGDSPFFLAINCQSKNPEGGFSAAPMGKNTLSKIVKVMAQEAGLQGNYTNHSLRKTLCQTLLGTGVDPILIAQLTGHKNVASVANYAVATKSQQKQMSNILTGAKRLAEVNVNTCPVSTVSTVPTKKRCETVSVPSNGENVPVSTNGTIVPLDSSSISNAATGMFSGFSVAGNVNVNVNYHVLQNNNN